MAAHTYIAHIRKYPSPPGEIDDILRLLMYLDQTADKRLFIQTSIVENTKLLPIVQQMRDFLPFDVSNQAGTR